MKMHLKSVCEERERERERERECIRTLKSASLLSHLASNQVLANLLTWTDGHLTAVGRNNLMKHSFKKPKY